MNKRIESIQSPHVLSQTSLVQSILHFLPLKEAMLSATVCKSWNKASEDGLKFHKGSLEYITSYEGDWEICLPKKSGFFPQSDLIFWPLTVIPEPRRSHLIDICEGIHFRGDDWSELIKNFTQAPSNLRRLEFSNIAPTEGELNDLRTYFDFAKIEEVEFGCEMTDFEFSSTPVEHVINAFPSLELVGFFAIDCAIDFKQVRPIHSPLLGRYSTFRRESHNFDT